MEQFNTQVFNKDTKIPWLIKWEVEINNFDLTSLCTSQTWIMIKTWNEFDNWNIDLWVYVSSMIDWWWVFSKKYWNKTLNLRLFIQWTDHLDVLKRLDELKYKTSWIEMDLDIKVWDSYRTYKATVSSITVPSFAWFDFIDDVELEILITNWNWYNKESEVQYITEQVTNFEVIVNNEWTAPAFPKIILVCKNSWNTITWISTTVKKIGDLSWITVTINETITNGDVIVLDYVNKIITINQVEVPFFNPMTPLEVWFNVINLDFIWSLNLDCYVLYNKVYL